MNRAYVALLAVILICLLPLASVAVAGWVAEANGCPIDENDLHACVIAGHDWGRAIFAALVSGWFMWLTLPIGALALLALVVVALRDLVGVLRGH